ncbi:MAG: DUF4313 domain-containing protein [bacterium]|nr:DUF4313 domain-containing protein [bacterium]
MKKELFEIDEEKYYLYVGTYQLNGRLYLGITDVNDNICDDITINLPGANDLGKDFVYLNGDMSSMIFNMLKEKGIFDDPLYEENYNYGLYKVVNINKDKLIEYDKDGYASFINEYKSNHLDNEMDR